MFIGGNHFESWWNFLKKEPLLIQELDNIINILKEEYAITTVYPAKENIFRAFRETSINTVKTVFVGMDPYINEYKGNPSACGLSFVTENGYVNPSLRILCKVFNIEPVEFKNFVLSNNALMLNTALTVQAKNTGSHLKIWNRFTELLIKHISKHYFLNWVLLGKDAEKYKNLIENGSIYTAPHPMAYQYNGKTEYDELIKVFHEIQWI